VSWSLGKHYLRLGGSVIHHSSGGFGSEPGTATLGTFTFRSATTAPFSQLTLADVQNYTQPINFGISTYELPQWLLTGFVQDSYRVRHDLTLDLGLRYDRQTLTDDKNNFAPVPTRARRFAVATVCISRKCERMRLPVISLMVSTDWQRTPRFPGRQVSRRV
jgi:outer membrane receptor protein involved in Fe transport